MAAVLVETLEARDGMPRIRRDGDQPAIGYGPGNGHDMLPALVDIDTQPEGMSSARVEQAVITVQVPESTGSNLWTGVAVAREVNDELVKLGRCRPDRLAALTAIVAKGTSEGGTAAAGAVIANAVSDGLGAEAHDLPLSPERIVQLAREGAAAGGKKRRGTRV